MQSQKNYYQFFILTKTISLKTKIELIYYNFRVIKKKYSENKYNQATTLFIRVNIKLVIKFNMENLDFSEIKLIFNKKYNTI